MSWRDILAKVRSAKREGWTLRLRNVEITVVLRHHSVWLRHGLPESAAERMGGAAISPARPGVRLTKEEVAAIDVDALERELERPDGPTQQHLDMGAIETGDTVSAERAGDA